MTAHLPRGARGEGLVVIAEGREFGVGRERGEGLVGEQTCA